MRASIGSGRAGTVVQADKSRGAAAGRRPHSANSQQCVASDASSSPHPHPRHATAAASRATAVSLTGRDRRSGVTAFVVGYHPRSSSRMTCHPFLPAWPASSSPPCLLQGSMPSPVVPPPLPAPACTPSPRSLWLIARTLLPPMPLTLAIAHPAAVTAAPPAVAAFAVGLPAEDIEEVGTAKRATAPPVRLPGVRTDPAATL